MKTDKTDFLFVRTAGVELARYGIKGTVESKLIEPLGIAYCTSYLMSRGFDADVYDIALKPNIGQAVQNILLLQPLVIGFAVLYSHMLKDAYTLITLLRDGGYDGHITMGGTYPTLSAEYVLKTFPLVDSVVRSEGELVCNNLCSALKSRTALEDIPGLSYRKGEQIFHNPPGYLIPTLDKMPNPVRDNFEEYGKHGGVIQIHSSRGCHANCGFCGTAAFYRKAEGPKWRARSASHSVAELASLLSRSVTNEVWFTDDNFIGPGSIGNQRAIEIAEIIIERRLDVKLVIQSRADNIQLQTVKRLKQAGLRKMYIGVESGDQRHLDSYNKRVLADQNVQALKLLEQEEVFAELGFIGFDPLTTLEEFGVNIAFMEQICGNSKFIHPFAFDLLIPYRGTPIAYDLLQKGLAVEDGFDFRSVIQNPLISEACSCVDHLLNRFGVLTEYIKSLIIQDGTTILAQEVILKKNRLFISCLKRVYKNLSCTSKTMADEINSYNDQAVANLERELGLSTK